MPATTTDEQPTPPPLPPPTTAPLRRSSVNGPTVVQRRGSVSAVPRVVEFYSGIGGMHYALLESHVSSTVVAAFDINDVANAVYKHNFPDMSPNQRNIEAVTVDAFERLRGDLFLMSPPCQPYTRTGKQQGSADPRAQSLFYILHLLDVLRHKPNMLLLENVKGFEVSDTRDAVVATLLRNQYTYREFLITPTQFDIPNSRLRYYLLAKRAPLAFVDEPTYSILTYVPGHHIAGRHSINDSADTVTEGESPVGSIVVDEPMSKRARMVPTAPMQSNTRTISDFIEPMGEEERLSLRVPEMVMWKSGEIFDIVHNSSKHSCCFTKAYGHYVEGSGSLLQEASAIDSDDVYSTYRSIRAARPKNSNTPWPPPIPCPLAALELRYFSSREIANLLGFPSSFSFPASVNRKQQYKLLGNSLSVHVVAALISYMWQEPPTGPASM